MQFRQRVQCVMRIPYSPLEKATKGDDSPVRNAKVVVHAESDYGPVKRRKKAII